VTIPSNNKSAVPYASYSKAPEDSAWNGPAAKGNIARWAGYDGSDKSTVDWAKYKKGFTWFDSSSTDNFGSYKLPHHDVSNGSLNTIWRGVAAAMGALLGARNRANIPAAERKSVYNHLSKHYKEFDKEVPEFKMFQTEKEIMDANLDDDTTKALLDNIVTKNSSSSDISVNFDFNIESTKANDTDTALYIEGYANTSDKDRYGDIVLPTAFDMQNFENNPIILLNHNQTTPIGKMVDYEIKDNGLWIKAKISKAAEDLYKVHTLITDGILKAFSIGFKLVDANYDPKSDTFFISKLELLEVSVVSVPANQTSLFEVSKAFDEKRAAYKEHYLANAEKAMTTVTTTETVTTETETSVTTETVEVIDDGTDTGDGSKQVITHDVEDEESLSDTEKDNNTKGEESIMPDAKKDTPQALTAKEVAEITAKAIADHEAAKAADADAKAAEEAERKAAKDAEDARIAKAVEDAIAARDNADETKAGLPNGGSAPEVPVITLSAEDKVAYEKKLDDLYLLSLMAEVPMNELKEFKALPVQVQKTVTNTGGISLAPIGFDNRLLEDIRAELKVEKLFKSFTMPLADYRLPFNAAGVVAEWITAGSTPTDRAVTFKNILFTAKKLMSAVGFNYEDEDDATVALLPTIRKELAYAMALLIDTTLISGDGTANDFRGVADYATGADVTGSHVTTLGTVATPGDVTPADIAAARAKMGRYALNPRDVVILINLSDYYKLVDDTTVQTITNYGTRATLVTGELANIWGIPIIPTEAFGTPAVAGDIRFLIVRPDRFMLGYRKGLMVEAWRDPRNQTKSLTASMRMDFNPLVPLTTGELTASETFVHRVELGA